MASAEQRGFKPVSSELECQALVDVLGRLGDKWAIMVVAMLTDGPMRYSELQRRIGGISQRMLTLTLKGLTEDGFLSRTVYPTIPPRVDYDLTEMGATLRQSLIPLREWVALNMEGLAAARAARENLSSVRDNVAES